ncbi:hypothetical protein HMPREF1986_02704 [Oribacterium sp. oral taxon 078 str. F0263]|nr:hypothetical protein HMPREF1986_02704 [Oribacterium sp. oral taxon 078 str. F0263]
MDIGIRQDALYIASLSPMFAGSVFIFKKFPQRTDSPYFEPLIAVGTFDAPILSGRKT